MKKWVISKNKWYHKNVDSTVESNDLIELNADEYEAIMNEYSLGCKEFYSENGVLKVRDMDLPAPQEVYDNMKSDINAKAALASSDWKVIRELERLYLAGTDLNLERESLRNSITHDHIIDNISSNQ
jgi:hypothetical protein